ncbi:hypothetical protein RJD24_15880 [Bacillaceae bacterium IKA-2]|nr:hypothetical protein RJD24_15880 [Bacillaceae bacterium IKA-2]
MDNMKKNDRRISIILNGEEKTQIELKKDKQAYKHLLEQEIPAVSEKNKIGEDFQWLLPENEWKQPSPKIVDLGERRRDKEKLAAPFWDDGKSEDSPKLPHKKRKKKRRLQIIFKDLPLGLIGIIISAIIVGTSFGLMMLTIFTGDNAETVSSVQVKPVTSAPAIIDERGIPTLAVEIIQGGAYTLVAKGHETAEMIKDRGFAAALSNTTDPIYLFIGVGLDREQATVISGKYQANGQEVYMKPYAVAASGTVATEDQALFLQSGVELYQQITLLSVNAIANGGSLLTTETVAELEVTQQNFQAMNESFIENEQQQLLADGFQGALASAYQQLQNFTTTEDQASVWQVQQFLLNSLIAYEELINSL